MRAIILAAGRGLRMHQREQPQLPKCLLRFGGMSLLERHLRLLRLAGVQEVALALGFEHAQVERELDSLDFRPRPEIVLNDQFELGSVVTLHTVAASLTAGGDVLLMDADVLYDERVLLPLVSGTRPASRLLLDREFEPGDEPVKVCVLGGEPIELRKQLPVDQAFDVIGESVGFFRFSHQAAVRLASIAADYVNTGRGHMPHEEAVRDLLRERIHRVEVADVTGAPWIEIDFAEDVTRASQEVLPQLRQLAREIA